MIEVTDEMRDILSEFLIDGNSQTKVARSIIELHEANKPKPEPLSEDALLSIVEQYTVWNLASHAAVARAIEQAHGIGIANAKP